MGYVEMQMTNGPGVLACLIPMMGAEFLSLRSENSEENWSEQF